MKITNNIVVLLMATVLSIGFAGCSDDDKIISEEVTEEVPDFVVEQESVRVRIGAEYKATIQVKGGGDYNAFCLDEKMAKAEIANNVITVEGFKNGQTSLIISDKYNRYRRLPISIYTTDVIELSHKEFRLETLLGSSETVKAKIALGNGDYEISSDNAAVKTSVKEEGDISITATSKKTEYTAIVTVKDGTGLSATISVVVKASYKPFTNEDFEKIVKSNTRTYIYKGKETFSGRYYKNVNKKQENGKQRYGWEMIYSYAPSYSGWLYLDFEGDKSVGVKKNAEFICKEWSPKVITVTATIEIIKNDGTNVWGVFFYIDDKEEKMYTGYFCDTVNPA